MPRRNFELKYQDGSKKHISREERDDLVLSGLAKLVSGKQYAFTGQPKTFHSFADLGSYQFVNALSQHFRRFLPGSFVIELKGKRTRELLETPEQMAFRGTMESVNL